MIDRIKHLWAHHRALLIAFVGVLAVALFFAIRTLSAMIYWMDPAHQDLAIAPWMSPRYVAQSYKLPPEVLGPALFLDPNKASRRISLDKIADENGMTMSELQKRIDEAAATWRAEHVK